MDLLSVLCPYTLGWPGGDERAETFGGAPEGRCPPEVVFALEDEPVVQQLARAIVGVTWWG
jgi:hypothetical protein